MYNGYQFETGFLLECVTYLFGHIHDIQVVTNGPID